MPLLIPECINIVNRREEGKHVAIALWATQRETCKRDEKGCVGITTGLLSRETHTPEMSTERPTHTYSRVMEENACSLVHVNT